VIFRNKSAGAGHQTNYSIVVKKAKRAYALQDEDFAPKRG
jgi:hypothetical protein